MGNSLGGMVMQRLSAVTSQQEGFELDPNSLLGSLCTLHSLCTFSGLRLCVSSPGTEASVTLQKHPG